MRVLDSQLLHWLRHAPDVDVGVQRARDGVHAVCRKRDRVDAASVKDPAVDFDLNREAMAVRLAGLKHILLRARTSFELVS